MSIYKKITAILLACSVCLPVVPAAAEEWVNGSTLRPSVT